MEACRGNTVATTNFPLYSVRVIGERHLLVAGGGGSAKTGVDNAIEIFELKLAESSTLPGLSVRKVTHYGTGSTVMNCSLARKDRQFLLAAGMESKCSFYSLRYKIMMPKVKNEVDEGLRKQKGNFTVSSNYDHSLKMIGFNIHQEGSEIVTDKSKDGSFQKAAIFTPDLSHLITSGSDGYIRLWEYPTLEKKLEQQAHTNEIDDIDLSLDGTEIVTVSKDNHIYLWNAETFEKIRELVFPTEARYRARNCRFAMVSEEEDVLFTTHISSVHGRRVDPSYIVRWNIERDSVAKVVSIGDEILSALAVSDNGHYVAVGMISGSVSVYEATAMQRLYHIAECHRIFVTGLDFLPTTELSRAVAGQYDFTLFSVSADSQIKAHQFERRNTLSSVSLIVGLIIVSFLVFWYMTAFDICVRAIAIS